VENSCLMVPSGAESPCVDTPSDGGKLGLLVKTLRLERGFTQDGLATKAVVSTGVIQRIEQAGTRGEDAPPWARRTLISVAATLHKDKPLSRDQMLKLIELSGVPANEAKDVEHTVRAKAGEFDGQQDRVQARSDALGRTLLDEIAGTAKPSIMELQYIVFELCQRHPPALVRSALLGLQAALDASLPQAQPSSGGSGGPPSIPGAVKHTTAGGATIYTPTSPPNADAEKARRKRSS